MSEAEVQRLMGLHDIAADDSADLARSIGTADQDYWARKKIASRAALESALRELLPATAAPAAPAAPEVPNSPGFPDGSRVPADARDATGRSPTDYALEFAEYLARGAEQLMEACNALHMAVGTLNESGDDSDSETLQQARDSFSERFCSLHGDIHEFRKRRDRAATAAPTPQEPT